MVSVDYSGPVPRILRSVPDPLGQFIRVGYNDHAPLLDLMARGDSHCFGFVIEATKAARHKELRERALEARLDVILDPQTQAAATVGGFSERMGLLPWGVDRQASLGDFRSSAGVRRMGALASYVIDQGYTQVLAPTHLITGSDDPWFDVDRDLVESLREQLDRKGGSRVQILYPLASRYAVLRDQAERDGLLNGLLELPIDAIWLQIEDLGADATANGVRNYQRIASTFSLLRKPVIADGIGGIAGLSLLAFGAAGGIAHGVTFGERIDHSPWRSERSNQSFGRSRRLYFTDLDLMLEPEEADVLLQSRVKSKLICRDSHCCPRGMSDMLENPARHFLVQRMKQVTEVGRHHLPIRASRFVENVVRPVGDVLAQSAKWNLHNDLLTKKLAKKRNRLDAVCKALMAEVDASEKRMVVVPKMRSARESRTSAQ